MLRSHGITKNVSKFANPPHYKSVNSSIPAWYYEMQELGYNYRITDIQCALGLSQLSRLNVFLQKREKVKTAYRKELINICGFQYEEKEWQKSSNHLFVIQTDKRNSLYEYLLKNEVQCQIHYIPIYRHPYYLKMRNIKNYSIFKNSEKYYQYCLSLPIYFNLKKMEQKKICCLIKNWIKKDEKDENRI